MQTMLGSTLSLKAVLLPKNNHWLRRAILVHAFILFDYFCTVILCKTPYEEANIYARAFMENFGVVLGLSLFVILFNLPIHLILSLDSHLIRLPLRMAIPFEFLVDGVFAWYVAGLHFGGGSSWFWFVPDMTRQVVGAVLYLLMALVWVKPYCPDYDGGLNRATSILREPCVCSRSCYSRSSAKNSFSSSLLCTHRKMAFPLP